MLCLHCEKQEPLARELIERNKLLVDRANKLFPSPYDNFGPARSYEHPYFFAAAVPICGGGDMNELEGIINSHLPIWAFHGVLDPVVDIDAFSDRWNPEDAFTGQRTLIKELIRRGMKPTPKYTLYADVKHDSWNGAYSDPLLFDWIFSQSKK